MLLRTRYMIETILKPPAELVVLTSGDNYYCVNNENGKYIIGVQAKIAIIILLNR